MIRSLDRETINPLRTDTVFQAILGKLERGVSRESGSVKSNCLPDRSASGGTPWWFFWAQPRTPIKSKSPTGHCGRYSEQLPLRPTTSAWRMSCGSSSCRELVGLKTTTPTVRTYHLDDNKELFLSLSLILPLFPPPSPWILLEVTSSSVSSGDLNCRTILSLDRVNAVQWSHFLARNLYLYSWGSVEIKDGFRKASSDVCCIVGERKKEKRK